MKLKRDATKNRDREKRNFRLYNKNNIYYIKYQILMIYLSDLGTHFIHYLTGFLCKNSPVLKIGCMKYAKIMQKIGLRVFRAGKQTYKQGKKPKNAVTSISASLFRSKMQTGGRGIRKLQIIPMLQPTGKVILR